MKGLTPATFSVFNKISRLKCIKPYVLVGGTALSLQLATRLSEDLDFMSWRTHKNEKREVDWPAIQKELATIGNIESFEILRPSFSINASGLCPFPIVSQMV